LESAYEASSLAGWYAVSRVSTQPPLLATDCKLYVSPRIEALAEAFPNVAHVFLQGDVRSFKIGRGLEGLLRPDKIVAYFEEREHMTAVADALAAALMECPVQGVPFSAEIGGDGLLSWGIDPPAGNAATSWRAWVTKRLATSLARHRHTPGNHLVEVVFDDIRKFRVDPECWLPNADAFL
ncbi:MAG: hypothetical protein JJ992_05700, partial [Planctomycetes bacterium]|nr:hypothetical protein [Planctomycetota bacterium]